MVLSVWNINILKAPISSCRSSVKSPFNSSLFLGKNTFIHLLIQKIFTKCLPHAENPTLLPGLKDLQSSAIISVPFSSLLFPKAPLVKLTLCRNYGLQDRSRPSPTPATPTPATPMTSCSSS